LFNSPDHLSDEIEIEEYLQKFLSPLQFKKHETGKSEFPLRWCLSSTKQPENVNPEFKCVDCGKSLYSQFNLNRHYNSNNFWTSKTFPANLTQMEIPTAPEKVVKRREKLVDVVVNM